VTRFSRALSKFGVVKIDKVEYRVPQIIFYQPGVGTGGFWDRFTGGTYGDTYSMPATWLLVPLPDSIVCYSLWAQSR
jgi:hypothetical protein